MYLVIDMHIYILVELSLFSWNTSIT